MSKSWIWRQRFGFGAADMASNFVWAMITTYLTVFYTDVVLLDLGIVGAITFISKGIDAVADIILGIFVDHTKTRWGKCRPYFLFGAVPFGICAILVFIIPPFEAGTVGQIAYAFITYSLVNLGYSVVNTPLSAILPSLTNDKTERNILVTFRMICAAFGSFCVTTFTSPMVQAIGGGDQAKGYLVTAIIFVSIAVVLFFFTFANTKEVVKPKREEKVTIKQSLKAVNKQYVLFIVIMFVFMLGFAIKQAGVMYFFKYCLDAEYLFPVQAAITSVSMIVGQLCITFFCSKFGKKGSMYIMLAIAFVGNMLFLIGHDSNVAFIMVGTALVWFALGYLMGIRFSLLADVVDYSEYKSGYRASGFLSSIDSFVAKLCFGLNVTIFVWLMSLGGYIPNQAQSALELHMIDIGFIGIPVACLIAMAILLKFFKVEKELDKMRQEQDSFEVPNQTQPIEETV